MPGGAEEDAAAGLLHLMDRVRSVDVEVVEMVFIWLPAWPAVQQSRFRFET